MHNSPYSFNKHTHLLGRFALLVSEPAQFSAEHLRIVLPVGPGLLDTDAWPTVVSIERSPHWKGRVVLYVGTHPARRMQSNPGPSESSKHRIPPTPPIGHELYCLTITLGMTEPCVGRPHIGPLRPKTFNQPMIQGFDVLFTRASTASWPWSRVPNNVSSDAQVQSQWMDVGSVLSRVTGTPRLHDFVSFPILSRGGVRDFVVIQENVGIMVPS